MTRKLYYSPSMEIHKLMAQQQLLFGSLFDTISTDGLFDEEIEQAHFDEEPLVNMWEDAR